MLFIYTIVSIIIIISILITYINFKFSKSDLNLENNKSYNKIPLMFINSFVFVFLGTSILVVNMIKILFTSNK